MKVLFYILAIIAASLQCSTNTQKSNWEFYLLSSKFLPFKYISHIWVIEWLTHPCRGVAQCGQIQKKYWEYMGGNVKQDTLRKQPNPWAMSIEVNLVRHFEMLVCYVSFLSRKCGNVVLGDHVINTSLYHHGNPGPILW